MDVSYRAIRRWQGPAVVQTDGHSYRVGLALTVLIAVEDEVDKRGRPIEPRGRSWVAEVRRLPRSVKGDVNVRLNGSMPIAARATGGLLVGDGDPPLPRRRA